MKIFKELYFINTKAVIGMINNGKLTDWIALKYLILIYVCMDVVVEIPFTYVFGYYTIYTGRYRDFANSRGFAEYIAPMISFIACAYVSYKGIIACYKINKDIDGADIFKRFIVLSVPVGITLSVCFFWFGSLLQLMMILMMIFNFKLVDIIDIVFSTGKIVTAFEYIASLISFIVCVYLGYKGSAKCYKIISDIEGADMFRRFVRFLLLSFPVVITLLFCFIFLDLLLQKTSLRGDIEEIILNPLCELAYAYTFFHMMKKFFICLQRKCLTERAAAQSLSSSDLCSESSGH